MVNLACSIDIEWMNHALLTMYKKSIKQHIGSQFLETAIEFSGNELGVRVLVAKQ